jgi:transketolase
MRACEQMRTFVAYPDLSVKFIGVNAGLIGGEREGVTHQFYEDLSILSAIPNFTIYTPADAAQTYHAIKLAHKIPGPVYIRAGSGRENVVYDKKTPFAPEGVRVLRQYGNDALLLANGFILDRVLAAAELLKAAGAAVTVADVNILNHKNPAALISLLKAAKTVVTVEDHNINGGLGSYICHLACEHVPVPVHRRGLATFGESGPAKELADKYGFSPESICESVQTAIKKK